MPRPKRSKVIPIRRDLARHFQADMAKERNVIGRKIAEARKRLDITQAQLAELMGEFGIQIQTPGVNKWESGVSVPNAYQLVALCYALDVEGGLEYFTGPVMPKREILNTQGQRLLNSYREFLESNPKYTINHHVVMIEMPVSLLPASAGFGDYLDDENMEHREFPASAVPDGADFAVPVDGDSMEPLYHDGQLAWIQLTPNLNVGDVGLFVVDGHGYIKTYDEREPEEDTYSDYLDADGVLHPQIVLISQNSAYQPKIITPSMSFRVVGRVLN